MTDQWTNRLSAYLDGELGESEVAAIEKQLADDAELRATLESLRHVKTAAANQADLAPVADLWPAIRGRLVAERPERRARTLMFTIPQFAAAAGIMLLLGIGLANMADDVRPSGGMASLDTADVARVVAVDPVASPDNFSLYVEDLEARLEAGRAILGGETVRVLEASLAKIDDAIEQARKALEADPNNAYLNQHLASARARKLRLLENATKLVASST